MRLWFWLAPCHVCCFVISMYCLYDISTVACIHPRIYFLHPSFVFFFGFYCLHIVAVVVSTFQNLLYGLFVDEEALLYINVLLFGRYRYT